MKLLINTVCIIVLIVVSVGYLSFVAGHMPQKYALMINIILFPLVLGILGAWAIQAPLYVKFILLLMIPITHVLYFGGDPAKPGLENLVALAEAVSIWTGVIIFYFADKLFFKEPLIKSQ